jgi:CheY-like chemotaxis protein
MREPLLILVVEDERDVREVLFPLWLEKLTKVYPGTELVLVETMNAALAFLKLRTPSLILLDLTLPDSLPKQTIQKIPEMAAASNVIVVSGSLDPGDEAASLAAGAIGFYSKGRRDLVEFIAERNSLIARHLDRIDDQIVELRKLVENPPAAARKQD